MVHRGGRTHEEILALIDSSALDLSLADEPEAAELLRVAFRALVKEEPVELLDTWYGLSARFLDGQVSFGVAIPFLVDLAESLDEPARCVALALLVQLGRDAVDDEASVGEQDAAFASVASQLDRLSGLFGLSPRLARRAAARGRGRRYALEDIAGELEKIEELLEARAKEHLLRLDAASRTPEALIAAARALSSVDDRTAAQAITLAHRCRNAGLPHETLLVCSKLGSHLTRAEPARIGALLQLRRIAEAKEATIALTRAWLTPATSHRSVNQVLLKAHIQELLHEVRAAIGGNDLDELARTVERAQEEVFIDPNTETF